MKKIIFGIGTVSLTLILFLGSCTKSNVKHGNKRIIGTWSLVSEQSETAGNGTAKVSFNENDCYDNYTESYSTEETYEINGTTVHRTSSHSSTQDGVTETVKEDTTYTETNTLEITFNEDGTCNMKSVSLGTDENGNPKNYNSEQNGFWNWIDAYQEKEGINIVFVDGSFDSSEMHLYIETLDKEQLIFAFTTTYKNSSERTYYEGSCWDGSEYVDVYKTTESNETGTETGNITMEKKSE